MQCCGHASTQRRHPLQYAGSRNGLGRAVGLMDIFEPFGVCGSSARRKAPAIRAGPRFFVGPSVVPSRPQDFASIGLDCAQVGPPGQMLMAGRSCRNGQGWADALLSTKTPPTVPTSPASGPADARRSGSISPANRSAVSRIRFLHSERNPRLVRVIRAHLHFHHVARGNLDVVLSQFARDVRKDDVVVRQLHPEHRPRQDRYDPALQFDGVALRGRGDGSLCRFGVGRWECFQTRSKTGIGLLATLRSSRAGPYSVSTPPKGRGGPIRKLLFYKWMVDTLLGSNRQRKSWHRQSSRCAGNRGNGPVRRFGLPKTAWCGHPCAKFPSAMPHMLVRIPSPRSRIYRHPA